MRLTKKPDGWWITDTPAEWDGGDYGPYATKADADSDRKGLERTLQHQDKRAFWTGDKR